VKLVVQVSAVLNMRKRKYGACVTVLADVKGDVLMFMRRAARAPLSKVLA